MWESLTVAMGEVFQWQVLLVIVVAAVYGIFVGSIPGANRDDGSCADGTHDVLYERRGGFGGDCHHGHM